MPPVRTIGSRIRGFREEREVDLQTLSQNTGLSEDYLEKLESDAIYPCIGPLQKVARALGVRLGTFLDDQFSRDPVVSSINSEAEADEALYKVKAVNDFLKQGMDEKNTFAETLDALKRVVA